MRLHKESKVGSPKVSLILLDWSVRESFHICHYLEQQTVPRDQFEILVIEYYSKLSPALLHFEKSFDGIALLEMPRENCYHKHLMYNIGFLLSKGEIVVICDSDAMVKPTFIETIIKEFEQNPNLILHLDQFRNNRKDFYPFNYPSFEEVIGKGCINGHQSVTSGIAATSDILHRRNYGACFCCRREDFIAIGGADEHIDYVGHICGPYDLTFRLSNLGRTEVWHRQEFLYHTWHPGSDGKNNYLGPHDGRNVSTTALGNIALGRFSPHVSNPLVIDLQAGKTISFGEICKRGISAENIAITRWDFLKNTEAVKKHAHCTYQNAPHENQLFFDQTGIAQSSVWPSHLAKLQGHASFSSFPSKGLLKRTANLLLFIHCIKTIIKSGIANSNSKKNPKYLPSPIYILIKATALFFRDPKFFSFKWSQVLAHYRYLNRLLGLFSVSFEAFKKGAPCSEKAVLFAGNDFQVEFLQDLLATHEGLRDPQSEKDSSERFKVLPFSTYRDHLQGSLCYFTKSALAQLQDLQRASTTMSSNI